MRRKSTLIMNDNKDQTVLLTASCGLEIPVRIQVNPRARRLILRLDEKHRQAVAIAPSARLAPEALRFAKDRLDWAASELRRLPPQVRLQAGSVFRLQGQDCLISLEGKGRRARLEVGEPQTLYLPGDPDTVGRRAERYLRTAARETLSEAVEQYCATLGVNARRVTVRDTKSRWGSCTSEGKLAFSWRLIMAPPEVLDYVAAHECAHLLEMNHSRRFWAHVERCRPHWRKERAWLRAHGSSLHAVSA